MLVETKARVGVFAIALGAYLPQFPTLVPEFEQQYADFKKTIPDTVEIVDGGIVTTKELSMAAGDKFRAADVDLVILQLLTYATSYNMLPAVRDLNVPVVLVNVQKKKAPDYANTDTPTWLGELYACGAVGEMVADLERAGKRHAVITGVVEKSKMITGEKIRPGYVAIGFGSNGLHTNGFSLARNIFFSQCGYTVKTYLEELGETVGEALLKPHICYYPAIRAAQDADLPLHGIAHITGGGFYENVPRMLNDGFKAVIEKDKCFKKPIFDLIASEGNIPERDMYNTFNMGTGLVIAVDNDKADEAVRILKENGEDACVIGEIKAGEKGVELV